MHLAFLGSGRSWYASDLARAAADRHTIEQVAFRTLASEVGDRSTRVFSAGRCLNDFDGVLVRTMPPGSLEQVVFRMDALARLEASGTLVVNRAKAIEVAVDKYLATARLQAAGLRVPTTTVCQTTEEGLEAFACLGGDVVLKPLFGSEGRGIVRLQDESFAQRTFQLFVQLGAVLYLQQFVEHEGVDLRLLVIGDRVIGMRRRNPLDWRTNVSRGAEAERLEVTSELEETAQRGAHAVGATLAGVDLLPGRDGALYAIEVNAVPGWRALSGVTGIDVAQLVLEHLGNLLRSR